MNVCFFGSYDPDYPRNTVFLSGLRGNDVTVLHCRSNSGFFVPRYILLIAQFLPIARDTDIIFVAYRGHLDVLLAWLLGLVFGKPVVFDIFYSLHDTYVYDRRIFPENSLRAKRYFLLDALNMRLADCVIAYTHASAAFLSKTFAIAKRKFAVVPVGGNDDIFFPRRRKKRTNVIVEFHGWFTRMQGAEYVIEAAKKLESHKNITFWFIGNTVTYDYPLRLFHKLQPRNMQYFDVMPEEQLAKRVADADISIGHLGNTKKAHHTISNRMVQALASKTALIAGEYRATGEQLNDSDSCILVGVADSNDLAKKILKLAKNKKLREKIAQNGYNVHQTNLTNEILGKKLKQVFADVLKT